MFQQTKYIVEISFRETKMQFIKLMAWKTTISVSIVDCEESTAFQKIQHKINDWLFDAHIDEYPPKSISWVAYDSDGEKIVFKCN